MRFVLTNAHGVFVDVVVEPGATLQGLPAGASMGVEWSGGGPAGIVCGDRRLTLVTPDGGHVRLWRGDGTPVPAGLWPAGLNAYPASPRMRLRIANATGRALTTGWEPTGMGHEIESGAKPLWAEWLGVEADAGTEIVYGPGRLALCDGTRTAFRGWRPDGSEIETLAWMIGAESEVARHSDMPWPARDFRAEAELRGRTTVSLR
ncbi:hypothetical protein [Spirilliplanes yamanashiensis]|uniref:Uncharacterized protein n=1 Tax=Spirilliplanes yamanashiensis TaxID=42233 RepID=A0A8J3YBC5_9ACTN|nr:hypothetical protein [Spirilliplanes yamanashiensis]MDP9817940.1 hypothetical protein [Spirilliplanes yamanashiensis]GIJ04749.1 hypothetical protein Sya03_41010 [Spirilliplanes yamanashiensis]